VITLLENNPQTGFCRFFIDKEADILELPTHLHGGINFVLMALSPNASAEKHIVCLAKMNG